MCIHEKNCRFATGENGRPPDRRYHTVLVGDLIIYVQYAREESARTGEDFSACLAGILVDELSDQS